MDEITVAKLIVTIMVAAFAILFWYMTRKQTKKRREAWLRVANRLGLECEISNGVFETSTELHGTVDGIPVKVGIVYEESGKSRRVYTLYEALFPNPLFFSMRIESEGPFSGIAKFSGEQDIEVGDDSFDGVFMIKGDDPTEISAYLTQQRRDAIKSFFAGFEKAAMTDYGVNGWARGVMKNEETIIATIQKTTKTIESLRDPSREAEIVEDDLEDVSEQEAVFGERYWEVEDSDIIEAEPNDAETVVVPAGEEQREPEPALEPGPEAEPLPPVTGSVGAASGISVERFCEAIFDKEDTFGSEAERKFKEFAGQKIAWSGALKKVQAYNYDFVFGHDAGTKAEFEICKITAQSAREESVKAVVQLKPEEKERLANKEEILCSFEGTLLKLAGMSREVFIAQGRLLG